jgi:hypothetical protein
MMTSMKIIPLLACLFACTLVARGADYVIAVSVDGLGSVYLQKLVEEGKVPAFRRLMAESVGTTHARADYDITVTLPNHTTMVTSRGITGPEGHNWASNTDPAKGVTLHSRKGAYVSSVFDVAHDHGLRTGVWATKSKFALFDVSYDATHGAPDATGVDNGRDKVDVFLCAKSPELQKSFIGTMTTQPCQFAFVHFGDGDGAGHKLGWGSEGYNAAMVQIDGYLGAMMDLIATNPALKGRTVMIVTSDHGGEGTDHKDAGKPVNFTIPFYVWGAGIAPGDLYEKNAGTRLSPGEGRPGYAEPVQPVRNGDLGNLALSLLGLPAIPGSTINVKQDLRARSR